MMVAVMALAMITASVKAELGETPQQMSSQKPIDVRNDGDGVQTITWKWKDTIQQGCFVNGRAVIEYFWFVDNRRMTGADIDRFLKPYKSMRRDATARQDQQYQFVNYFNKRGTRVAVAVLDTNMNELSVWTAEAFKAAWAANKAEKEQQWEEAQPPPPLQKRAQQAGPRDPMQNKDCAITATENLHRLAPNAAWSATLSFDVYEDGKFVSGHVVAIWKIATNSKVWAVDQNGTLQIETTSTDVKDILMALGAKYSTIANKTVTLRDGCITAASTAKKTAEY